MPHATAPVFNGDGIGMNSSGQPKETKWSAHNPNRWMATKTTDSVPRKRWRSRSQAGTPRLRTRRLDSVRPHRMLAVTVAQATIPLDLATYHASFSVTAIIGGTPGRLRRDQR